MVVLRHQHIQVLQLCAKLRVLLVNGSTWRIKLILEWNFAQYDMPSTCDWSARAPGMKQNNLILPRSTSPLSKSAALDSPSEVVQSCSSLLQNAVLLMTLLLVLLLLLLYYDRPPLPSLFLDGVRRMAAETRGWV